MQAVALACWENEGGSGAVEAAPVAPVRLLGYTDFEQKNASHCEDMSSIVLRVNQVSGG